MAAIRVIDSASPHTTLFRGMSSATSRPARSVTVTVLPTDPPPDVWVSPMSPSRVKYQTPLSSTQGRNSS